MGLDTSHDCFSGPYTSFMAWRQKLAEVAGLPPLLEFENYTERPLHTWAPYRPDPLVVLLDHSDCEDEIAAADCLPLAIRLEGLAGQMPDDDHPRGHRWTTLRFARGLRAAAAKGESVEFH